MISFQPNENMDLAISERINRSPLQNEPESNLWKHVKTKS